MLDLGPILCASLALQLWKLQWLLVWLNILIFVSIRSPCFFWFKDRFAHVSLPSSQLLIKMIFRTHHLPYPPFSIWVNIWGESCLSSDDTIVSRTAGKLQFLRTTDLFLFSSSRCCYKSMKPSFQYELEMVEISKNESKVKSEGETSPCSPILHVPFRTDVKLAGLILHPVCSNCTRDNPYSLVLIKHCPYFTQFLPLADGLLKCC